MRRQYNIAVIMFDYNNNNNNNNRNKVTKKNYKATDFQEHLSSCYEEV